MPYPNYHAARMVDPDSFIKDSIRTKEIAPGIMIIIGKKTEGGPMETQAYRFNKDQFTEDQARAWLKNNKLHPISFEKAVGNLSAIDNEGSIQSLHDIRLQRLDYYTPYPNSPTGKLHYKVDNFAGTESDWDNSYAVFVPPGVPVQHVDHAAFARDPKAEAARLGFAIVGKHAETKVIGNGPGEPRISTKAVITDPVHGPTFDALAKAGKLSLSSGFDANIAVDEIVGKVKPNHVLYFMRGEPTAFGTGAYANDAGAFVDNLSVSDKNTPRDAPDLNSQVSGSGILDNISEGNIMELGELKDKILGIERKVDNIVDHTVPKPENEIAKLQKVVDNMNGEMKGKEAKIAELEAKIEALEKEKEALEGDKKELDNIRKEQAKAKKDAEWAAIKNMYAPGMFHKPEDEKAHREAFERDAAAFVIANVGNLAPGKVSAKAQGSEAAGAGIDNIGGNDQKIDMRAAIGRWDPKTNGVI